MYAGAYYGGAYYGQEPSFPVQPTTRPDCGGAYGTATYASRYYAGHVQCGEVPPVTTTRPDCGGVYGTTTYAGRYYGGHIQCGVAPPPPPPPPPASTVGTGDPLNRDVGQSWIRQQQANQDRLNKWLQYYERREGEAFKQDARDKDDLEVILSEWLNIFK